MGSVPRSIAARFGWQNAYEPVIQAALEVEQDALLDRMPEEKT